MNKFELVVLMPFHFQGKDYKRGDYINDPQLIDAVSKSDVARRCNRINPRPAPKASA